MTIEIVEIKGKNYIKDERIKSHNNCVLFIEGSEHIPTDSYIQSSCVNRLLDCMNFDLSWRDLMIVKNDKHYTLAKKHFN